ncbi:MAG: GIN domain-containing protein [Bacteroidales bacterium]
MKFQLIIALILFSVFSLVGSSCQKEDGGGCVTTSGPMKYEERPSPLDIDSLIIRGEFRVTLKQDKEPRLYLYSGANLLPGIITRYKHKTLYIEDLNTCDFLRDLGLKTKIFISVTQLKMIEFTSSGTLESPDTLQFDSLRVESRDGAGSIRLLLDTQKTWLIQHSGTGAVDFTAQGRTNYLFIYNRGYAPFHCDELICPGYTHVVHYGSNNCRVNCGAILQAELWGIGDIYYSGSPHTIWLRGDGKGRLIHIKP